MAANINLTFAHTVDRFYGIGNKTPDLGTEEYILEEYGGILDFQIPPAIGMSDRSGLVLDFRHYSVVDVKENPYLQNDTLNGIQGGNVSGLGLIYVWDTRDNVFFPNKGGLLQMKFLFYTKDLGSDYAFNWIEIDSRRYWAFNPDQVIAFQLFVDAVGGDPPFYELPALGGPRKMRGYFQGRYRDYNFFTVQVEYRQYVWRRLGFVAFFSIGDVASEITQFQVQHLKKSYGVGIRFLFNKEKKINLRADIGIGKDTSGIYFGMEEAF
jgi:outer membrane protein assembly factor BamA